MKHPRLRGGSPGSHPELSQSNCTGLMSTAEHCRGGVTPGRANQCPTAPASPAVRTRWAATPSLPPLPVRDAQASLHWPRRAGSFIGSASAPSSPAGQLSACRGCGYPIRSISMRLHTVALSNTNWRHAKGFTSHAAPSKSLREARSQLQLSARASTESGRSIGTRPFTYNPPALYPRGRYCYSHCADKTERVGKTGPSCITGIVTELGLKSRSALVSHQNVKVGGRILNGHHVHESGPLLACSRQFITDYVTNRLLYAR